MTAAVLPSAAYAQAIPQHELFFDVDFDGTPSFSASDPNDDGLGGHTPGEDLNANNNVLRTNDQIQYSMTWNVNEADASGVTIVTSLPPNMEWLPDATTVTGVPAGCTDDGTSSINTPNPGDLICIIEGDQIQGSNGTIRPRALLNGELDGVLLPLSGTISSNEQPNPASSNTVETTVSAVPRGDWIKGKPIVDSVSRAIIAYEPDEKYFNIVDENGVNGQLFVWSLRLVPRGGLKGAEPINDAIPIQFFDHFFDSVPGARLASDAMMPANNAGQPRLACGGYDGDNGYPYGQTVGAANATPAAQTNIGLWQCTDMGAPNGYPQVQIDITGHDTANIAASNADLGPNAAVMASGQIAMWAPRDELIAKPNNPRIIVNAISGTDAAIAVGTTSVAPIQIAGTNGPVDESTADGDGTGAGLSNDSPYEYGTTPPSQPGAVFRHSVAYKNGPYQENQFVDFTGKTYQTYDDNSIGAGGTGRFVTNGVTVDGGWARHWDGDGQTPRGNVLSVQYQMNTQTGSAAPAVVKNEPIHACVAIDTTHQEVVGMPPTFPVVLRGTANASAANNTLLSYARPIVGGATGTPASPVANVITGRQSASFGFNGLVWYGGTVIDRGQMDYVIEVAAGVNPGNAQGTNAVTCNGGDAAWVNAVTGDLSQFQTGTMIDGTPIYGGITHMRVITSGDTPWGAGNVRGNTSWGAGLELFFQVRVKDDPSPGAQEAEQELAIYGARASGEWDGTGQAPTPTCTNAARWNQELAGSDATATGWCNLPYADDGATSTTVGDQFNEFDGRSIEYIGPNNGFHYGAHADKIFIVEAALAVSKSSPGGASQVVANGNVVEFEINPQVVGSSLDEIDAVTLTDTLPSTMVFQGFTSLPSVGTCAHAGGSAVVDPFDPTQTVIAGGTITCTYGDDYAGGWGLLGEGKFGFEVMIVGAVADATLTNTATLRGNDGNTGEPKAAASSKSSVFTGAPFDESVIVKAIDTGVGDCDEYPGAPVDAQTLDPQPADWADRCERIVYENSPAGGTSVMGFTLEMANQGNTPLTNVRFVDVLPHNADEMETFSNTGADGVPVPTLGDGRTPETDTDGDLSFIGLTGDVGNVWVSGDDPLTISRDPARSIVDTTWCTGIGGSVIPGGKPGVCPATADDVTGVFAEMDDIDVGDKISATLTLQTVDHECDDIWTNTFGARVAEIGLPVRSNDVSIMVDCVFDLALTKVPAPGWSPGADWLTPGASTVDFVLELINQGDPINNFEITDYVDSSMFTFDINDNLGGFTNDALGLEYTWDNSGANPVVTVNDPADPTSDPTSTLIPNGASLFIPVTLTVSPSYVPAGDLINKAEISYFDNDADAANGDSASGDVTDVDSLADGSDGDPTVDDEIDNAGGDEDDHDIAIIPVYDVAIEKLNPTISQTATGWEATFDVRVINESNSTVTSVEVLEAPPTSLTYDSSSAGSLTTELGNTAVVSDADPVYTIDQLASGDAVTFTITYVVNDLTAGPYVNSVQIDSFDGADGNPATDVDSTPGNDTDPTVANEDDDDTQSVSLPFDLALVKKPVVNNPNYTDILDGVQDGDEILFEIEVFNQLSTVEDFDIIDYLTPGWVFDLGAQVSPEFTGAGAAGGPVLPYSWDTSGADPVVLVDGVLPAGESVIIPIVLTADIPNNPLVVLRNVAEILRFDDDGDPTNGDSSTGDLVDLDSTPDGDELNDPLVDDEFNDDGTTDEDDHDEALTTWYDVALDKTLLDGGVCVEGPLAITAATVDVTYCLSITNEGPTDLFNIAFTDTPPAGLVFDSESLVAGVTGANGSYVVDALAPGASVTIEVTYTLDIAAMTSGSLDNVAEVTGMTSDAAGNDPAGDIDSFVDPEPDGDTPTEDDEDLQTLTIPHDLALVKTLGPIDGNQVTMYITVTNQSIGVETIEVTDYVDPAMWEAFSGVLNPPALATATVVGTPDFSFFWDVTDPDNPVATLAPVTPGDKLLFGESLRIPIVLEVSDDFSGPVLDNHAEISNFDDDGDDTNGDAADGTLTDVDSTPDDTDGNGAGETINSVDDGTDGDANNGGDEDDYDGVIVPIYDLALVKTVQSTTPDPLEPGGLVTFLVTIENQGTVFAADPTLIDYVDPGFFDAFDDTLGANASGVSTGDQALAYTWTPSAGDGILAVTGSIAPGESITVPVTLQVTAAPTATTLTNTAEITGGTATDEDGDEVVDGAGEPLEDVDSDADDTDDDTVVDDVTNNDGGDEDDHDIADVFLAIPMIELEKATNNLDSDIGPGAQIASGDPVTWSYEVINTGTTALLDVEVTDSDPGVTVVCAPAIDNVIALLIPGETVVCEATGTAGIGAYMNTADVSGTPAFPADPDVDTSDPDSWPTNPADFTDTGQDDPEATDDSHYFGTDGGLELEKATNGIDADEPTGPVLEVGDAVVWTYEVTNTSSVAMLDVTVDDSDIGAAIDCGNGTNVIALLTPGAVVTCTSIAPATAVAGQYMNDSTVEGTGALPTDPADAALDPADWPTDPADYTPDGGGAYTDEDPSHYFAFDGGLSLEKSTNGVDSDDAPGEQILSGNDVTWTYAVTNDSTVAMVNVTVDDSDPAITVDCGDGSNQIAVLAVGETVVCEATGTAVPGLYANDSNATGTPGVLDPSNPNPDSDDPASYVTDDEPVSADDPSHYSGADPSIGLEKATNGDDADDTLGPVLSPGDTVTWTYEVTNDGTVPLTAVTVSDSDPSISVDCGDGTNVIALLVPGQVIECEATGSAELGAYENTATVEGTPAEVVDPVDGCCDPTDPDSWPADAGLYEDSGLDPVADDDLSHYVASDGDVVIEKFTNNSDADVIPGVVLKPGDPVVWTYRVANTSNTPLVDLLVTDDQGEAVDCGDGSNSIALLLPGETAECEAMGVASDGQYTNIGSVTGTPGVEDPEGSGNYLPIDDADPVSDDDPSNHLGAEPAIGVEKATNGDDADNTVGPLLAPGDTVTWTYVVTNDGPIPLINVTVVDNDPAVTVVCDGLAGNAIEVLAPGQSVECEATGTATVGAYENVAVVNGTPATPVDPADGCCDLDDPDSWPTDLADLEPTGQEDVSADDPSHYVASDGDVMIVKSTNGADADDAPGAIINIGDPVTWSYTVVNGSTTPLVNLTVTDDQGEAVDCGAGGNTIALLLPGATHVCEATGIAGDGQYTNIGSVTGTPAEEDPDSPTGYTPIPGVDPVSDENPSNYLGADPSIDIEKSTNGDDADNTLGPVLATGDTVTWEYVVTNDGQVPLADMTVTDSDPLVSVNCGDGTATIALLLPTDSATCTATGTAETGAYENLTTVEGTPVQPINPADDCCDPADPASWPTDPADFTPTGQDNPSDEDLSHYVAYEGGLSLEKSTNGVDSDDAPGEQILSGNDVTWTYAVTNDSSVVMVNVTVADSDPAINVDCGGGSSRIAVLTVGETVVCEATGTAVPGLYTNDSTAAGAPALLNPNGPNGYLPIPDAPESSADDPSHYSGADPSIGLEKSTNGDDADNTLGPVLSPGDTVTWTYEVTNDGTVPLTAVTVSDSDPSISVDCGDGTNVIALLVPGQVIECEATGSAELGAYENTATVEGTPAEVVDPVDGCCDPTDPDSWPADAGLYEDSGLDPVADDDLSHYVASDGDVVIEKFTNNSDADVIPGVVLKPGDPVVWTYRVANTSNTPLVDLLVTDDQGEAVDCGDGSNSIALLLPGETAECEAMGVASDGQYTNIGSVTGTPGVEDPEGSGNYLPIDDADPVSDDDPSNHLGAEPAIGVEKATNGDDADNTVGPLLAPGDTVTWTYVVTNDGPIPLINVTVVDNDPAVTVVCDGLAGNAIEVLAPGQSVECEATGTATVGAYENVAVVNGTPATPVDPADGCCDLDDPDSWPTDLADLEPTGQEDVSADDPSHYVASDGDVMIVKSTNGTDADAAPGVVLDVGDPVTWSYTVINGSTTPLVNLTVTDDQGEAVDCGNGGNSIALLLPGATHICEATGVAGDGQYTNIGSVTGTPAEADPDSPTGYTPIPGVDPVSDENPSNYLGADPSIDIEKSTNGDDADNTLGPVLAPGDTVTWEYVVTNDGQVPLADMTVTDSDPTVSVNCGDGTATIALLLPTESATCTATGTAELGAYENLTTVEGTPVDPVNFLPTGQDNPSDEDLSHYVAVDPSVTLEKSTNTVDADAAPGPIVTPGDTVTWTYVVINDGSTPLVNLTVADDQGVVIDCGDGTNDIGLLLPNETAVCTGSGAGADGAYVNLGSVTGKPALENPDAPGVFEEIDGLDPVEADDPSNHLGLTPAVDIEKATNGDDADTTSGPLLAPGDDVVWTYVVTNNGEVPLVDLVVTDNDGFVTVDCGDGTNTIGLLLPTESITCTATGTASVGEYENIGSVTGTPVMPSDPSADCCDPADPASWPTDADAFEPTGQDDVSDQDLSHYVGEDGEINLQKSTNGVDADEVPGVLLAPGDPVTWTYVVTNTSDTPLINVAVADDQGEVVDCGAGNNIIAVLLPGAVQACEATGVATAGQYTNTGSVSGTPAQQDPANAAGFIAIPGTDAVTDEDPSNYVGAEPGIDIEKSTNGVDSDTAPGEEILEGDDVTWTYVVTNTGDITMIDVEVTDDQGVVPDCGDGTNMIGVLAAGDSVTCTATSTAGESAYSNVGNVTGTPAYEDPANPGSFLAVPNAPDYTDTDTSHYEGVALALDLALRKTRATTTNGPDQTFNIEVINQGSVIATDILVVDHLPPGMVLNDDDWFRNDASTASVTLSRPLAPGESRVLQITTRVGAGSFRNLAGIEGATAVHPTTGELLALDDVDSVFADSTGDTAIDNVIDNSLGDEDDSDFAEFERTITQQPGPAVVFPSNSFTGFGGFVPRTNNSTTQPPDRLALADTGNANLAYTGSESGRLLQSGILLVAGGAALVAASKRRRRLLEQDGLDLKWKALD